MRAALRVPLRGAGQLAEGLRRGGAEPVGQGPGRVDGGDPGADVGGHGHQAPRLLRGLFWRNRAKGLVLRPFWEKKRWQTGGLRAVSPALRPILEVEQWKTQDKRLLEL